MYYIIGAAFCIGFVLGMAFGMVRGKKELADEIKQQFADFKPEVQKRISNILPES